MSTSPCPDKDAGEENAVDEELMTRELENMEARGNAEENQEGALSLFTSAVRDSAESLSGAMSKFVWDEGPHINVADTYDGNVMLVQSKHGQAHFSCPRTLPHPSLWPNKPLLLRESVIHKGWDAHSIQAPIPLDGTPYPFETELFKGVIMFRYRGCGDTDEYFKDKNRLYSTVISGQFKREMAVKDVQTGQEFCKPVKRPSKFLVTAVTKFFRLLAPLLNFHLGDKSYMLSPLAQTAQIIHVGDAPYPLHPNTIIEENFGSVVMKSPMDNFKRKKRLAKAKALEGLKYTCDKYYTFDFYNDKVDVEKFELLVLGQQFSMSKYLQGQPIRVLSRLWQDGEPKDVYLWNFELWHESVVNHFKHILPSP